MENNNSDKEEFMSYNKPESFKEILLSHLRRITTLSSVEYRGGYTTTVEDRKGNVKEIYISDSRELYENAILTLCYLLQHKFDKKMKEQHNTFQKELQDLKQNFLKSTSIKENVVLGESFYENLNDKILLEEYKIKKLQIYHAFFSELCLLLGRLNYMEIGGGTY